MDRMAFCAVASHRDERCSRRSDAPLGPSPGASAMTRGPLGGMLVGPMTTIRTDTRSLRGRRAALIAAVATSALLAALMSPSMAMAASVWREGAPGAPFHLASSGGSMAVAGSQSDQSLTLAFVDSWSTGNSAPWSVVPAGGDSMLVAEPGANRVRIVDSAGNGTAVAVGGPGLNQPHWAAPGSGGTTLIADTYNSRVVEVDGSGVVVRQFDNGSIGLDQPYSAVRVDADTTLIADTNNDRVLQVGPTGAFGGQYGHTNAAGSGTNYLSSPGCAIRIANGSTVIADTGNNRLVIIAAVNIGQTPTIIGAGVLNKPTSVYQTSSGTLLVADTGNNRVVEMDLGGAIVSVMNSGLKAPTGAARLASGVTAIADNGDSRLVGQGPGTSSGTAQSGALDFGLPGVTKKLNSVAWNGTVPSGAGLSLSYRLNGGTWKAFPGNGKFSTPPSFTTFEYRLTLTGSPNGVPTLNELAFNWDIVPAPAATGGVPLLTSPGGLGSGTGFGTYGAGGSYTGTGTPVPEVIFDNGIRRGWVMESVGTLGTGKLPGPGGMPSQPLTRKQAAGLALLGGMWGIGIALQPIGKLLLALRGILPFPTIGGS
jgi:hypothetical protein